MHQLIFGLIAGGVVLLAHIPYVIQIKQGKLKPNRATWWIWAIFDALIASSSYASGGKFAAILPGAYAIGAIVVAVISIRHGEGGANRFDFLCILGAIISGIIWWRTNTPILTVWSSILVAFIGALPTIKKVYLKPETECATTWFMFLLAALINIGTISFITPVQILYPIYSILFCSTLTIFTIRPKLKHLIHQLND